MIERRNFLTGLLFAPFIVRTPGILMPVKPVLIWSDSYGLDRDEMPTADQLADRKRAIEHLRNKSYIGVTRGYGGPLVGAGIDDLDTLRALPSDANDQAIEEALGRRFTWISGWPLHPSDFKRRGA